jgi:hypothetical protein
MKTKKTMLTMIAVETDPTSFSLLWSLVVSSTQIQPIYWRIDNHQFEDIRHVKFDDKLDIFCPENSNGQNPETTSHSHHYQTIHLVDREAYESCLLNGSEKYVMRCDSPHREKKFTMKFVQVNPSPFGFEFDEGDYFLISTSSGDLNGQDDTRGGVCSKHQMRVKFVVSHGVEEIVQTEEESSDYSVYQENNNSEEVKLEEIELIETPAKEKLVGSVSTAIIVSIVFFVFIDFV